MRKAEANAEAIDIGNSKEDVLKAVGSPDRIETNNKYVWKYGNAYVSFDSDWKVNGWKNYNNILTGKVVGE
jgi:hypothetical protein